MNPLRILVLAAAGIAAALAAYGLFAQPAGQAKIKPAEYPNPTPSYYFENESRPGGYDRFEYQRSEHDRGQGWED